MDPALPTGCGAARLALFTGKSVFPVFFSSFLSASAAAFHGICSSESLGAGLTAMDDRRTVEVQSTRASAAGTDTAQYRPVTSGAQEYPCSVSQADWLLSHVCVC
ncbi:hypothetical protein [Nakamurella aerolata]|uniref:Uncharacterized protein n=1 Tax=Nakamurella aerolata TaxID=1656892 RepID=A0A849ACY8_9ACTN|nr:hypothetical protein [Nakamurella aerolata]NNG34732.1 hypothetical protein [Nakamurella aerolata]